MRRGGTPWALLRGRPRVAAMTRIPGLRAVGRPLTSFFNQRFADLHVRLDDVVHRQDELAQRLAHVETGAGTESGIRDELVAIEELLHATLNELRRLRDSVAPAD